MSTILLAQIPLDIDDVLATYRTMVPSTRGALLIFGAIGLVTLLALIWAIFIRKARRRRRKQHHAHEQSPSPPEVLQVPKAEGAPSPPTKGRHRRRSGRRHRSSNPTLAQTGGLPPVRPEDPPEPRA